MSESFPCLICGKALQRELDDYEAQPRDGVMCRTTGNYGSRVYDSILGDHVIDFNICDDCFVKAGEQGRLFERSTHKVIRYEGTVIGGEEVDRPYTPWSRRDPIATEWMDVDEEELDGLAKQEHVTLLVTPDEARTIAPLLDPGE